MLIIIIKNLNKHIKIIIIKKSQKNITYNENNNIQKIA